MSAQGPKLPGAVLATLWAGLTGLNLLVLPPRHMPRVKVETVSSAPLELMVRAPGVLKPALNAAIKAAFDGPVLRKLYAEGERVRAGQLLLEIGRDEIQAQYMAKANEVKNARLDFKKASGELRLQKALYRKMAVALSSLEDARRALEHARQNLEVSTTSFRLEEQRWNHNLVAAPFDGTVTRDSLGQEKEVSAGKELLSIGDLSSYAMDVNVDELDIGQVKEGQRAVIRLQAYEGKPLSATVAKIGAHSEDKGMTEYSVSLRIAATAGLPLLPQFTGEGRILVGKTGPVLSVPLSAVAMQEGKRVVWVVDSLRGLRARPVEVGRSNPERVEVTQGLVAGERVCAAAETFFRNGLRVRIDE